MRLVILESPYAGTSQWKLVKLFQRWLNIRYAKKCLWDSLERGEAPIASHLLYTLVLNDNNRVDRQTSIEAGLAWRRVAEASVVYVDRGITHGMKMGIEAARCAGVVTEFRSLNPRLQTIRSLFRK